MRGDERRKISEDKAMEVAEASRQASIGEPGFLKELFLGNFRIDLIHPFPEEPERPEFVYFYERMQEFLHLEVDPVEIDTTGEYPARICRADEPTPRPGPFSTGCCCTGPGSHASRRSCVAS